MLDFVARVERGFKVVDVAKIFQRILLGLLHLAAFDHRDIFLDPDPEMIDAARGVILRGAGLSELWLHSVILWTMGIVSFMLAAMKFRKRLS